MGVGVFMSDEFSPSDEVAWQQKWADNHIFETDLDNQKPGKFKNTLL